MVMMLLRPGVVQEYAGSDIPFNIRTTTDLRVTVFSMLSPSRLSGRYAELRGPVPGRHITPAFKDAIKIIAKQRRLAVVAVRLIDIAC
jgi:hypothetical protein